MPEYFTSVRPWALAQENSLLAAPPMAGLTNLWTSDPPRLPEGIEPFRAEGSGLVVTEEAIDFFPGGLVTYWSAYGAYREASATVAAEGHLGVLVTMVGPLHRVYAYRAFADADHALRYEETRRADPAWRAFTGRYRNEVTGSRTSLLRPSPVPRQRSLFEPAPDRDGTSGTPLPTVATPGAWPVSAVPGIGRDVGRELDPASVRALLACEDLIVDTYARADAGRRYSIADLFEEDGSHTLDDATVAGREAIRGMLAARDVDPSRRTLHVVTNLRSDQVADDRMHVRYILTLYLLSEPGAGAFVPQSLSAATDVLVRRGDRWLLRSRDVRVLTGAG